MSTTETPTPITRESFTAAMREAVAIRGADYVYPAEQACLYTFENGEPGCIIGLALSILGYSPPSSPEDEGALANHVLRYFGVSDKQLRDAALGAQRLQDAQMTWGQALERYEECLGLNALDIEPLPDEHYLNGGSVQ